MLHAFAREEQRRTWAKGPANRADARLRRFCRVEGEAVFCGDCDGGGLVSSKGHEPIRKCPRCGGEGLEPK